MIRRCAAIKSITVGGGAVSVVRRSPGTCFRSGQNWIDKEQSHPEVKDVHS